MPIISSPLVTLSGPPLGQVNSAKQCSLLVVIRDSFKFLRFRSFGSRNFFPVAGVYNVRPTPRAVTRRAFRTWRLYSTRSTWFIGSNVRPKDKIQVVDATFFMGLSHYYDFWFGGGALVVVLTPSTSSRMCNKNHRAKVISTQDIFIIFKRPKLI